MLLKILAFCAVPFPRLTLAWEFLGWSGNFRALRANVPRKSLGRGWEERGEAGRARPEGVLPTEVAIGIAPCDPPEGPVSADCVGNTPFPSRRQPGKKSSRVMNSGQGFPRLQAAAWEEAGWEGGRRHDRMNAGQAAGGAHVVRSIKRACLSACSDARVTAAGSH